MLATDELFQIVEEKHGLRIPEEYRTMHARGWLSLDRPAAKISTNPGDGYLFIGDMEWYKLDEIAKFEFPHFCSPVIRGLVPFAFTGGGDYWCWESDTPGPRVLLCWRDNVEATVYAPNFAGAIFRTALDYATHWAGTEGHALTKSRLFLHRCSVDLRSVCPSAWCDVLAEISKRCPVECKIHKYIWTSLLSPEEKKSIEAKYIGFPGIDTTVRWMK